MDRHELDRATLPVIATFLIGAALAGCGGTPQTLIPLENPAAPGSSLPRLTRTGDIVLLSWVELADTTHTLRFARWTGDGWSAPRTVASGDDWFVNWADYPSVRALGDGVLVAHWLARAGEDPYAYNVELAVSRDEGASWSAPIIPHRDGTETEHGFATLFPVAPDQMGVVWLDGRETGGGEGHDGHGAGGPMTLRYTTIDAEGTLGEEVLLDDRVCDCCGTDAVLAGAARALIVYRDRSDTEVRDISRILEDGSGWSVPAPVHEDGWKIDGCPVNGPGVASFGNRVAAAWFTGAGDAGRVRVAFSEDGGEHFEPPITLDTPDPLGRVDVEMDPDGSAIVAWLEAGEGDAATIQVHRVSMEGKESAVFDPVPTRGDRASGFPQLVRIGDRLILAWTELGEPTRVRTAIYR